MIPFGNPNQRFNFHAEVDSLFRKILIPNNHNDLVFVLCVLKMLIKPLKN